MSEFVIQDRFIKQTNFDWVLINQYSSIKNKSLNSNYSTIYTDLCNINNPNAKYKSNLEADTSKP